MEGLRHLKLLMGDEFGMVVSDATGSFPNEGGLAERLGFIFNWTVVSRKEMVTDVTHDRSKVLGVRGLCARIGDTASWAAHNTTF